MSKIRYEVGDVTELKGNSPKLLLHIVNDSAATWGAGFGKFLARKWPHVQHQFALWAKTGDNLKLGSIKVTPATSSITTVQLVCQKGYGPSKTPRLRLDDLEECLQTVADIHKFLGGEIHMPRIGTGEAGGHWEDVEPLVRRRLCSAGISVVVHDLHPVRSHSRAKNLAPVGKNLFGKDDTI